MTDYYTYAHHLNLVKLEDELYTTKAMIKTISLTNNVTATNHLNHIKLLAANIQNKLDHLLLNHARTRTKRGLINGLGTAISWITGNMDANDKAKYDNLIDQIERNEEKLETNVNERIIINDRMINQFNADLTILNKNSQKIKKYFEQIDEIDKETKAEQQYILILVNLMLLQTRVNDIDQSLEFCKSNTIHSSILPHSELLDLIKTTDVPLISHEFGILWELGKVYCSLSYNKIHYFIQFPIKTTPIESYFLLSHPTKLGTIIPEKSFIVKDRYSLSSSDKCIILMDNYYCEKKTMNIINNECIRLLLFERKITSCSIIKSNVSSIFKYVPMIDMYLSYDEPSIVVNTSGKIKVHTLYTSSLVKLEPNETLLGEKAFKQYFETETFLIESVPSLETIQSNYSFEQLHRFNVENKGIPSLLFKETTINHNLILYIISGIIILLLITYIVHNYKYHLKLKSLLIARHVRPSAPEETELKLYPSATVFAGAAD